MKTFFLFTYLITCLSTPGITQSATASTSATIVNAIEFSKEEDMKFETTKISSADNKRNLRPAINPISTNVIETRAEFSIGDLANNCVSITVTDAPINFNTSGGKVVLRNLKNDFGNQNAGVSGKQFFKIRGDLYIDPTAEAGSYSNSRDMVVVINFN